MRQISDCQVKYFGTCRVAVKYFISCSGRDTFFRIVDATCELARAEVTGYPATRLIS